jgi:hypothetical protein
VLNLLGYRAVVEKLEMNLESTRQGVVAGGTKTPGLSSADLYVADSGSFSQGSIAPATMWNKG